MNHTIEKQTTQMNGTVFYGEMMPASNKLSDAEKIMNLVKTQIVECEEQLVEATYQLGKISMNENDWACKNNRMIECKKIEAEIYILNSVNNSITEMFSMQEVVA
ncbi:MAG: hypothetical protein R3Y28_07095 [Candidatus Gastranaerophilales bacterium]